MSVDALPQSKGPAQMQLWFDLATANFRSPFSGKVQRVGQYGLWRAVLTWEDLDQAEALALVAFFNKAQVATRFTFYDPARPLPRGRARNHSGVSTGKAKTGSQRGRELVTYNWTETSPGKLFLAGDLIGMTDTGEVYEVTEDVDCPASSGDDVTITIGQFIRTSPEADEVVMVEYVPFTMVCEQVTKPRTVPPTLYTFDATLVEDF